jgi:pimeloyl-ACP methyl ester carboxylesterase
VARGERGPIGPARVVGRNRPALTATEQYRAAEARLWGTLGAMPRGHRLRLTGLGCDVRIQEVGAGPPALFVHGGSTSGSSWAELAAALPDHRCLLLDRPGTGLSDPLPTRIRTLADLTAVADVLIPEVLDALGLASSDVIATSFGGWFALRAALVAPERIARLVLFGWTAGAPVDRLPLALRLGVTPVIGDLIGRIPVTTAGVRAIFRGVGSGAAVDDGRISREAIAAYTALLRWTPTLQSDRALGRVFFSARGLDDRIVMTPAERARIATPIDWLWGDGDAFGGEAIARSFVEPFPDARLTVARGAGHAPWVDDLEASAAFVAEALGT